MIYFTDRISASLDFKLMIGMAIEEKFLLIRIIPFICFYIYLGVLDKYVTEVPSYWDSLKEKKEEIPNYNKIMSYHKDSLSS